jgi:hypothetical protein
VYEECIHEGGDEERCAEAAKQQLQRCVEEHCKDPKPPPCADRCEALTRHVFEACKQEIDAEKLCGIIAHLFLEHCTDKCEGHGDDDDDDDDCDRDDDHDDDRGDHHDDDHDWQRKHGGACD